MQQSKLWTREFTLLTLTNMFYVFGFYMLMPTVPLFVKSLSGTDADAGIVAASFTISAIIMRFFSPLLLTKLTKRTMLRLGITLSSIVTAACGLAFSIPTALLFRVFQGFGFGIVSTICATFAADLLPDSRRGEGIGYFGMGTTAMVAFSPAIGLFLARNSSFTTMFFVAAAGQLVSLAIMTAFSPPAELNRTAPKLKSPKLLLRNLFEPTLTLQIVLLILFGICRSAEQNFLSLVADERGIALSSYFIFQTAVSFVAKFITGKLYDRRGHAWAVISGGGSLFFALTIMSLAKTLPVMLIAGFFSGFGMGALLPAMQSWTLTSLESERRSVASAIYYNYYDIGISVGSIALGYIAKGLGYVSTFRTAAVVVIVFLTVYITTMLSRRRNAKGLKH